MGNSDNLKVPSSEEARKYGQKGGIASGKARQERKKLQAALQKLLVGTYEIGDKDNKETLGGYDAIAKSMILEASRGNVKAFIAIRDTIGEKPVDVVDFEDKDISGIKIKFVNKSQPNKKKEKDPVIVGDYTPPSNTEE